MFYKKLIILGAFALSACGFSPLYSVSGNQKITEYTEQIQISPVPNYEGYRLQTQVSDQLNPYKKQGNKTYVLDIQLNTPTYTDQSIQNDNFSSRENVTMSANYVLKEKETGRILVQSSARAIGSYNILTEPYATTVSRNKLRDDLVDNLADSISLRIIAYFKSQKEERES